MLKQRISELRRRGAWLLDYLVGLEDLVVQELRVPTNLIDLSCFDRWHFILNRSYVYDSGADDAQFDVAQESREGQPLTDCAVSVNFESDRVSMEDIITEALQP